MTILRWDVSVFTVVLAALLLPAGNGTLRSAEKPATAPADTAFAELDAKIERAMSAGRWSEASLHLLQDFYQSYKAAHERARWGSSRSGQGKLGISSAQSPQDYVGRYGRSRPNQAAAHSQQAARPLLTISQDDQGRFFVQLEKHRIPAVPWNGAILFTSGDVVYSTLPQLGDGKPHATLELLEAFETRDGWVMVDPAHPDRPMPLVKLDTPATRPASE